MPEGRESPKGCATAVGLRAPPGCCGRCCGGCCGRCCAVALGLRAPWLHPQPQGTRSHVPVLWLRSCRSQAGDLKTRIGPADLKLALF